MKREAFKLVLLLDLALSLPLIVFLILLSPRGYAQMLQACGSKIERALHSFDFAGNPRAQQIRDHAMETFESPVSAEQWLYRPLPEGRRPVDILLYGTPEEQRWVDESLNCLEHGIPS